MQYNYIAPTVASFVQRLVTGYAVHGYVFFYAGRISDRFAENEKVFQGVDRRMIRLFGCDKSRRTRVRRKAAGLANCHYLRLKGTRDFVIVCTHGKGEKTGEPHPFFERYGEKRGSTGAVVRARQFRDFREDCLRFHGYSVALKPEGVKPKRGATPQPTKKTPLRGSVRIHMEEYLELKAYFVEQAKHRSAEYMSELFINSGYQTYAPVREQLKAILRACNRARKDRGFEPIPLSVIPRRRRVVKACELAGSGGEFDEAA